MVNTNVGRQALVTKISDGLGYRLNDSKYIGKAYNKGVTLKHMLSDSMMYITDFFMPEFMDIKNDYCYYGFLIVSESNLSFVE